LTARASQAANGCLERGAGNDNFYIYKAGSPNNGIKVVVTPTGNVAIATTTTAYPLQVGSNSSNGNGAYLSAAGLWVNASDARIKENVRTIPYGLDAVMKLNPVAYEMKDSHEPQIGFIAQDVLEVVPEVVGVPPDLQTGHYGLSYGNLTAVTVKAIQELSTTNDDLREQVRQEQEEIEELRGEVAALKTSAP
jgi:hypothetical protein